MTTRGLSLVVSATWLITGCGFVPDGLCQSPSRLNGSGEAAPPFSVPMALEAQPGAQPKGAPHVPAQILRGMQTQPGMQPGVAFPTLPKVRPPGALPSVPSAPRIDRFNVPGRGSNRSSGMGELTKMESLKDVAPTFKRGGEGFSVDCDRINIGEAVVAKWNVTGADSLTLRLTGGTFISDVGKGAGVTVPRDRHFTVVVPQVVGPNVFTLTATNPHGSSSRSCEIMVLSAGQRKPLKGSSRAMTFLVTPDTIRRGETVRVYWNVLDADRVFLETDLTRKKDGTRDERDRVPPHGTMTFTPPESTDFFLFFNDSETISQAPEKEYAYNGLRRHVTVK